MELEQFCVRLQDWFVKWLERCLRLGARHSQFQAPHNRQPMVVGVFKRLRAVWRHLLHHCDGNKNVGRLADLYAVESLARHAH